MKHYDIEGGRLYAQKVGWSVDSDQDVRNLLDVSLWLSALPAAKLREFDKAVRAVKADPQSTAIKDFLNALSHEEPVDPLLSMIIDYRSKAAEFNALPDGLSKRKMKEAENRLLREPEQRMEEGPFPLPRSSTCATAALQLVADEADEIGYTEWHGRLIRVVSDFIARNADEKHKADQEAGDLTIHIRDRLHAVRDGLALVEASIMAIRDGDAREAASDGARFLLDDLIAEIEAISEDVGDIRPEAA